MFGGKNENKDLLNKQIFSHKGELENMLAISPADEQKWRGITLIGMCFLLYFIFVIKIVSVLIR